MECKSWRLRHARSSRVTRQIGRQRERDEYDRQGRERRNPGAAPPSWRERCGPDRSSAHVWRFVRCVYHTLMSRSYTLCTLHPIRWIIVEKPANGACVAKGNDDKLPPTLRALWRHADRQRKVAPPRLSVDRIVAAAVDIAEEEGLTALSMARLAERLDCAPMSLYRHVASKDELQALMIDIAPGAPPDIGAADWREGVTRWARELRAVYVRHPWILQIAISGPPREPGQLAWLECGLRALERTNLDPHDTMAVIMLVLHYVRGEAQLSTTLLRGRKRSKNPDHDQWIDYTRTLSTLIDPYAIPRAHRADRDRRQGTEPRREKSDRRFRLRPGAHSRRRERAHRLERK